MLQSLCCLGTDLPPARRSLGAGGCLPSMGARRVVLLTPSKSLYPIQLLSRQQPVSVSPLAATLMNLLASVANKRLTARLNPLDATLTKNRGMGAPPCASDKDAHPERLSGVEGFFSSGSFPPSFSTKPFVLILFRTLLRNGRLSTLLESVGSALFPSRRRAYPPSYSWRRTFSTHDSGADKSRNALPSAAQIRRPDLHEASEHFLHTQQTHRN